MEFRPSFLVLEDGNRFDGFSPSWQKEALSGEVVFSTGMTGYEESLTDPSYTGQILAFTYPLIGNYGVPARERWESTRIAASGVVVSEACLNWSHTTGMQSLLEWLQEQNVPIITAVDTRALTHRLREAGSIPGVIAPYGVEQWHFVDPNSQDLVSKVTVDRSKTYGENDKRLIVVDCGMKENILRSLRQLPVTVVRVPYDYDYSEEPFDGVLLSNGPGDPTQCQTTVRILQKAMAKEKPIFGICLGTQLLALAAGASTYKLRFGHRGHNQPCIEEGTERCVITSQNHGYAIDEASLHSDWRVSYRNLNDDSVEGIAHRELPFSAIQFHPEATPGPTDTQWMFKAFVETL